MMKLFQKIYYLFFISFLSILIGCKSKKEIQLVEFTSSECGESIFFGNLDRLRNRILEIKKVDNFVIYKIFVVTNCNKNEQGDVVVKNDTLNLFFQGKPYLLSSKEEKNDLGETFLVEEWVEEYADCDCAFELSYKIKGLADKNYTVIANDKIIETSIHKYKITQKKPTYSLVGNDTVNYVDIYGLKQGMHIYFKKDGKPSSRIEYLNNERINGLVNTLYNYDGYDKVETYMENKKISTQKYFNKGKLIKTCDVDFFLDKVTNCKYEK